MVDNQFQIKGFLVWTICVVFFLYEFLLHTSIGTFQTPIMQDLNLNSSLQFSLLSTTMFVIVYGVMQLPVGIIVNSMGLRNSLMIGASICTIATFGFSYSYNYEMALICRFFMGLGSSFGFICLLISVYDWMPHRYSALFIGISQFIGTLGPMIAAGPLNLLSESMGANWRIIFLGLGVVGLILTFLIIFFVTNNHEKAGKYVVLRRPEKVTSFIKRLFTRIDPWHIAIFSACVYFCLEYLSENEGSNFLSLKGISLGSASYMITVSWIGHAIGCPLLGFLSDFLKRRKIVMILSAVLALLSIVTILYSHDSRFLLLGFFFLGMGASCQSVGFAAIAEQFKGKFVAIGFGLINAMITAVAAINAPMIGRLLDYTKKGVDISLNDYLSVFNVLIVVILVALIVSIFFIKETYCKSQVDFTYLKIKPKN